MVICIEIFLMAVLCCVAYLVGVGRRKTPNAYVQIAEKTNRALAEMQLVINTLQSSLKRHQIHVNEFDRQLKKDSNGVSLDHLDSIIRASRELSSEIDHGKTRLAEQVHDLSSMTESRTDALTGIGNRRQFDEALARLMTQSGNDPASVVIALLDIDHFKLINDTHGHAAGDAVLQQVAKKIRNVARGSDLVARVGGEEFAIIFSGCVLADARGGLERIRKSIEQSDFTFGETTIRVTLSAGIASGETGEFTPSSIMSRADAALYEAKHGGRNQVCPVVTDNHRQIPGVRKCKSKGADLVDCAGN